MEIKYLEWNLHSMGGKGYKIPNFITEYIKLADIFVLVEFCTAEGWSKFKNNLEKEFDLYCSPYVSKGYNQVCIGLRRKMKYKLLSVVTKDVCNVKVPEFLQVDIEINNRNLSIIGTRIKTQNNTKDDQYSYLIKHLKTVNRFICLGDFNCVYSYLSEKFSPVAEVYGPRISNGYHSFVFENGDKQGLDWILAKDVEVCNLYHDKKLSPKATYDWSFITESNGYLKNKKDDFLNVKGLPDHAILKGMIKI